MERKEVFIAELSQHLSSNATPRPKHMKRIRTGMKISPIGLILLCSMVAIGMLTGLLYTMFTVNITGDVQLNGTQHPLFSFDGTEFDTPYLNLSADLTELNSGETKTFTHWIINEDAGAWLVNVDLSQCQWFYNDPPHMFYGLNVSVGNWKLDGAINTDHIVAPGENISFDITWELHHEFVTAPDPFPSNITISLTRTNEAPTTTDDFIHLEYNEVKTVDVLANDNDFEGEELTILSVTTPSLTGVNTAIIDNKIQVTNWHGAVGTFSCIVDYTISDGVNDPVIGHLTIEVHWGG